VDIYPDNDEPGAKWLAAVLASLEGKVKSLRILRVPSQYGDVADLIDAQGTEMAEETINALKQTAQIVDRGVNVALLSSAEAYRIYVDRVRTIDENGVDLGKWLPSLRQHSRMLLPGDMVVILSDTGVGKTAILLNIAQSQRPLCCIFFELELSTEPMCERFIARTTKTQTLDVETKTKRGEKFDVSEWDHVYMCPSSKVSVEDMRDIIVKSELKTQQKPALVLVDYIGLMDGQGGKRYEKVSNIAEGLKQLARETNTVIVVASQINRDKERTEVSLHDAKESGSIENSAQLVIGAWRPSNDRMSLKILKNTKKAGQVIINCLFDGNRQFIGEYDDNDLA
jgi:replicative DNA helicase